MRCDVGRLMEERNIDVAVVEGPDGTQGANPAFAYMTHGARLVGTVILKRGEAPLLIYRSMERDEAEATGLELINQDRWPVHEILGRHPDRLEARVELYRQIFEDLGVHGRVAFYGTGSIGAHYAFFQKLAEAIPSTEIIGEFERDLIAVARETKDSDEIEIMQRVGQNTSVVMEAVVDFLRGHRVADGTLVKEEGRPLRVADVKRFVRLELATLGLEATEEFIFAVGRDAGVPHSRGRADDPVQLGKTIVFDLFPRDETGYFHDVTRTFCLGYAPRDVEGAYRDVMDCFDAVVREFRVGEITQRYQHFVCDFFEACGHATIKSDPKTQAGYVHSLAHGLGLEVHEEPYFPTFGTCETVLREGMVFTVEPGLYYPERGFGIRVEDTVYCDETGEVRSLTPFPKDLVIPMEG